MTFKFINPTISPSTNKMIGDVFVIILISTIVLNWTGIIIYGITMFFKNKIKKRKLKKVMLTMLIHFTFLSILMIFVLHFIFDIDSKEIQLRFISTKKLMHKKYYQYGYLSKVKVHNSFMKSDLILLI